MIEHVTHPTPGTAAYVASRSQTKRSGRLVVTGIVIAGNLGPYIEGELAEDLPVITVDYVGDNASISMSANAIPTGRLTCEQGEWVMTEMTFALVGASRPTITLGGGE